jgi:long-chain fatty acid transport protein
MLNAEIYLRCGFLYDPMPVESDNIEPVLPEGDRLGGSLGIGMKMSDSFTMDLSYLGIYGMQTEVENNPNGFNGIYNAWANIFALSLSYHIN